MTGPGSAAARYKEITARVAELVERQRQRDRERAAELDRAAVRARQELAEAGEREHIVRVIAEAQWEAAVEALWEQRWMTIQPLPALEDLAPQRAADVAALDGLPVARPDLNHLDREVERTYQALEEALRKRTFLRRR
ncbi:hypothetical protein LX15_005771 [Streptoalloteichus tenebrarius]|uniref:Uncharacterized protein n=1 Tax=Streptoalloteichus tenebrarius (strain ATCC 17920 / DSM 40477 / JCM 4838 / CBS 697.72 / NBRC 16177 / NCIMB 11028 / NRRL B-12390 / A12253. 1 / ISP 5477) TaxID=1933 RepID=A0ABT1I2N9_STRSD|nr:hypothetical protein [Streptoalloteichus tenebrarius]MCP2262039.1 hypothetical protein [Streptoalloteichus tenebrarius]BFF01321.1 hypothetical protein GCM10020241_29960 [Streptoalloteichus tenebrarius]